MKTASCYNRSHFFLAQGIHIVTDAAIWATPVYPVWRLNIKLYQKIALTGVFLIGAWYVYFLNVQGAENMINRMENNIA